MSRYEVSRGPSGNYWRVFRPPSRLIFPLTETEAHIIAWSLNRAAEGKTLGAWRQPMDVELGRHDQYEGTVEGVFDGPR